MAKGRNNQKHNRKNKEDNNEPRGIQEVHHKTLPPIQAKNTFQKNLLNSLKNSQVSVALGPAGSGKTYVCMGQASDWLKRGEVDKVLLTRPSVGMGNTIGLLKGDLEAKFSPYITPMLEVIKQRHGRGFLECQMSAGNIEFVPFEYLRGRNIEGVCVLDEAQNSTPEEMYALLTRIAENGKLIIMGDSTQTDIKGRNGIEWLESFVERYDLGGFVSVSSTGSEDIVRGGLCKAVVQAKEKEVLNG